MVWSYCGHSFTNILELLYKSKKKEEKNKTKRLFIQLLRKWTLHAAGLLPLLTLASLRGVRALNREVNQLMACWLPRPEPPKEPCSLLHHQFMPQHLPRSRSPLLFFCKARSNRRYKHSPVFVCFFKYTLKRNWKWNNLQQNGPMKK